MKVFTFLFLAINAFLHAGPQSECKFESLPVMSTKGSDQVLVYLEKDKPIFWEEVVPPGPLVSLRAQILPRVPIDPIFLLKRQHNIFKRQMGDLKELELLFDDMKNKRVGRIKDINCLEALLYSTHLSLQGVEKRTEFSAAIYKFSLFGEHFIKVILKSGPHPFGPDITEDLAEEELEIKPFAVMHNHPFVFDNNTGDIAGTLIPSGLTPPATFEDPEHDLKHFRDLARSFGVKEAWITNGFHTSHFSLLDKTGLGNFWIH